MLTEHKQCVIQLFKFALKPLLINTNFQPEIILKRPNDTAYGDISCNIAMQLAKILKRNSRELAQFIVNAILNNPHCTELIARANFAGPGFINLYFTATAKQAVIKAILINHKKYGASNLGTGKKVLVEFISANPTGPLHVGHGRQGVLGDVLSNLLKIQGYNVTREFYYNDSGKQITILTISVQARIKGLKPGDKEWPESSYNGEYINDIAQDFINKKTILTYDGQLIVANGIVDDIKCIRLFAIAYLRREQDFDLQVFGIKFDNYYSESSLYIEGKVLMVVKALIKANKTYQKDGALWLRTTDYGDDKDRVIQKTDGTFTYFVPDIAYHISKWKRGFIKAINIQGSDHHSTITRVRAGLQAICINIPKNYPDYVIHKMVTVVKNNQEVKISKRSGSYVTLSDLIKWSNGNNENNMFLKNKHALDFTRGRDAVRFFLISRKANSEFVFNIDIALTRSDKNPVYYVQYAHARICSILNQWGGDEEILNKVENLSQLITEHEMNLLTKLAEYPDVLMHALQELEPHHIIFYLRNLAKLLHSYYNAERILVDNYSTKIARLALIKAARQVLHNGLVLIGVSTPKKM